MGVAKGKIIMPAVKEAKMYRLNRLSLDPANMNNCEFFPTFPLCCESEGIALIRSPRENGLLVSFPVKVQAQV